MKIEVRTKKDLYANEKLSLFKKCNEGCLIWPLEGLINDKNNEIK